ncbi:SDR family NAD(P)-dependent oxidoreductase [Actinacidiphila glaucinigra]|uniref:SDR family NAD(P)-dependent oxidoreductase n=1 Tax=Actinacidiphila glaucinigra TaxID=235986 RepID=UPI003D927F32
MTVSLITGGTRGLGRETARRLIGLGHTVHVGGRDEGRGRAAADELGAHFLPLDVTDDVSVAAAAAEFTRREGRLDVLVNNAGAFEGMRGADEVTAAVMRQVFETNVFGTVRMTHAFLPLLLGRRERAWDSGDRDAFVDADSAFHLAVVAASHNEVLAELYADLGQVVRDSLKEHFGAPVLRPRDRMDHARLLDAIRAGDAATAAGEAASHTSGCRPGG